VIEAVQAVLAAEAAQGGGGEESAVRFLLYFFGCLTDWNSLRFSSRSGPLEVCQKYNVERNQIPTVAHLGYVYWYCLTECKKL